MYIYNNGSALVGVRAVQKYETFGPYGHYINREDGILIEFYNLDSPSDKNPFGVIGKLMCRWNMKDFNLMKNSGDVIVYFEDKPIVLASENQYAQIVKFIKEVVSNPILERSNYVSDCLEHCAQDEDRFNLIRFTHDLLLRRYSERSLTSDEGRGSENDYTLKPSARSAWITVDGFSVYVKREDEGVVVDIYAKGEEGGNPIAGTYAFAHELEEV